MATAARNTTPISNFEASPQVMNDPQYFDAKVHNSKATVEIAAADNDADIFAIVPVHSSWALKDILIINDAITVGTDYNIGLYTQDGNGGITNADENCYADAVAMSTARTAWTSVKHGILDQALVNQQVWQDAGAAADPNDWYYLCLTAVTVGTAAGTISLSVDHTRVGGA